MSSTTRFTRTLAAPLLLAATFAIAPAASAQVRQPTGLGNVFGNLQVTEPRGDFKQNTGNGFGLGAGLLLRIDPKAVINWRTELGVVSYGRSSRRIPLAGNDSNPAIVVDARCKLCDKSTTLVIGERSAPLHVPAQHDACCAAIHMLPAGSTAGYRADFEFGRRNAHAGSDIERTMWQ